MPRYDRTGPRGEGQRTGRGLGICNTKNKRYYDDEDADPQTQVRKALKKGSACGPKDILDNIL